MSEYIEPTEDEIRNGWTAETLTRYVRERTQSQARHAGIVEYPYQQWGDRQDPNRPEVADSRYNPMRW